MASWVVRLGDGTKAKLDTDAGWTHEDKKLQKRLNEEFPPGIGANYSPDPYGDSAEDVAKAFYGKVVVAPKRNTGPKHIQGIGDPLY